MNSLKFFCFTLCAAYFSVAYADITAKDQTSIEAICKNIKPLLSVVLQSHDLKKEPFKHTPNKIASTSKEVVEKVKKKCRCDE